VVAHDRRVRASLAGLLALDDQVEVVATAGRAAAALAELEGRRPGAVVVDPRLPDVADGVAFVRDVRTARPEVTVVVIAWSALPAQLLADDPRVSVVAADGGDLGDRVLAALRPPLGGS
jgi:DNA-binding NarL/FixJ family response regulator